MKISCCSKINKCSLEKKCLSPGIYDCSFFRTLSTRTEKINRCGKLFLLINQRQFLLAKQQKEFSYAKFSGDEINFLINKFFELGVETDIVECDELCTIEGEIDDPAFFRCEIEVSGIKYNILNYNSYLLQEYVCQIISENLEKVGIVCRVIKLGSSDNVINYDPVAKKSSLKLQTVSDSNQLSLFD